VRVLGVDPGYHRIGLAIVECAGNRVALIRSRLVETSREEDFHLRLQDLFASVQEAILEYNPDALAVEELFFAKNVKTAIGVAHARGVILLAAAQAGLPLFEYKPSVVKLAITSNGNADKAQIEFMVERLLGIDLKGRKDDEIDAIAVALCHSFKHGGKKG